MLNVNAKAFVPKGAADGMAFVPPQANVFYRYHLALSNERVCDVSESTAAASNIFTLLTKRWLCSSSLGGTTEETLQLFLASFFGAVENTPHIMRKSNVYTGILLSRSILSLSVLGAAVKTLEESPGFIIRVDLPKLYRDEVCNQLRAAWEGFFEGLREDFRLTAFGYVNTSCGTSSESRYAGTYRHYFFISCTPWKSQLEPFNIQRLLECPFPILRAVQVNCIVPFLCNPRTPLALVISVGDVAKEKLLSDGNPDKSFLLDLYSFDVSKTLRNMAEYEEKFLALLTDETITWDRTYVVYVEIKIHSKTSLSTQYPFPLLDVIQFIGNLCDDTSTTIVGLCFSNEDPYDNFRRLGMHHREEFACYTNTTLQKVLQEGRSLDISTLSFGRFPQYIKRPIGFTQYEYVRNKVEEFFAKERKPISLTRMIFADAADNFASKQYYVRHKVIGEKILLITDEDGAVFVFHKSSKSIFGLRNCFGGAVAPLRSSIFEGMVTSSFRGCRECVIILEDILCHEGADTRGLPFPERWHYVEKSVLDDHISRPHSNSEHVVILRAAYFSCDRVEHILKNPPSDHPTLGLVFVPNLSENNENKYSCMYSWVPPESITAIFIAGDLETIADTDGDVKRVRLYVNDKDGNVIPYNGEYTDYLYSAYPLLKKGSIFECMLRRSDDGAHWWEVLKDFDISIEKEAYSYQLVEKLVHVPGITYDEMLWLLKAATYKCGRCQSVSDMGKVNPKNQVYWCRKCWEETGHGECIYCGRPFSTGRIDGSSKRFYCDTCWSVFFTMNKNADIGYLVPPPPNALFATQVLTRCVSLLIDMINQKAPTNDVLDLCCGGAVTRKWIKNKTARYVGFDLKVSAVEATTQLISSLKDEIFEHSRYDVICADAFSLDLWTQHITKIHPQQFHAITCFAGLHHAFDTDTKARHVVGSIANALVPGGAFFGCFLDASTLYAKGEFSNDLFSVEWDEDFVPRMGHQFFISMEAGRKKKINVIPIDFLVAIAREYGLSVIPEVCLTFREIVENDANWTKVPTKSEKEYLCAMRTFAFRKDSDPQTPSSNNILEKGLE